MNRIHTMRTSLTANIIGAIVLLLSVFGLIVSTLGFICFTSAFKAEYNSTTYHMADTAASLVTGDHLEDYLDGKETEEYEKTQHILDRYCQRMHVSLVYVIAVDQSDYGRFVSVFNAVNNSVDNTEYTPWELGYKRDTTNDEYRQKYKKLYEEGSLYEVIYRIHTTDGIHPHITAMVPVKNSAGETAGILCIQRPVSELYAARRPYLITIIVSTIVLAALAIRLASYYMKKEYVTPIRKISAEATRFAKENTKGEPLASVSGFREIYNLAVSIDTMEDDMVGYMKNLAAATAERERSKAELTVASSIQESTIPGDFPAFPDREDFDIYASMTPAREVGGDFYNFILIDDDHLAIFIGDVSGKGVPAALFMMVTNIMIAGRIRGGGSPAAILEEVNGMICRRNKADMFVTLWLGILEISAGRIVFANAGHDDAAVCRGGLFDLYRTKHGLVIGALPESTYTNCEIQLENGDKLFLYTDGVTEAADRNNRLFGTERMLVSLNSNKEKAPRGILEGMYIDIDRFVGDAPQFDDITMLCLELKEHTVRPQ